MEDLDEGKELLLFYGPEYLEKFEYKVDARRLESKNKLFIANSDL